MYVQVRSHGPGLAGACFGAGWCFWADAVLVNAMHGNKLGFLEVCTAEYITYSYLGDGYGIEASSTAESDDSCVSAVPSGNHCYARNDSNVSGSKV